MRVAPCDYRGPLGPRDLPQWPQAAVMFSFQQVLIAGVSDSVALLAIGFILGQGFALWGVIWLIRSQKEWTRALLYAHETNAAVHQSQLAILVELRKLKTQEKIA